jgi:hypothetical protein
MMKETQKALSDQEVKGQKLEQSLLALGDAQEVAEIMAAMAELVQPWYSDEELFDTVVDVGIAYLEDRIMPPDVKANLKVSKAFWSWFRTMWHVAERKMLSSARYSGITQMERYTYLSFVANYIHRHSVNSVVMKLAEKEAEKLGAKLETSNT